MSQSQLSLKPALMQALISMVEAQAPKNRPMTIAEVEQAVFDLFKCLGPELSNQVMAEQIAQAEKRGTGRNAAAMKCTGSDAGNDTF